MSPSPLRKHSWSGALLIVWFWLVLAFLFAPLVVVVVFSFNDSEISTLPLKGFTLRWYEQLIADENLRESLTNSLIVSGVTVILSTALGVCAAYGIHRYASKLKTTLSAAAILPIMVPHLILGIALLSFFDLIKANLSLITVILGHVVIVLPYVILIVSARLVGFNPALEEAARDLGANTFTVFWRIVLPLLRPAIIGGALLAFTLSFDEVIVTFFTTGTENTLPIVIWSMLRFGITPEINAIATFTILVSGIAALAAELMIRSSRNIT